MDELIKQIIKQQKACYFISPHLDDAILSAGDLILHLTKRTKVTAISLFTQPSQPPYTYAAKGFLRHAGYKDASTLFADRRREDKEIFNAVAVEVHHLGFQDSSFREKTKRDIVSLLFGNILGEAKCVYPIGTYNKKISPLDTQLQVNIAQALKRIVIEKDAIIFCPLAVGDNIDHQITRNVCTRTFANKIYWTDFPYSVANPQQDVFITKHSLQKVTHIINDHTKKNALIAMYKTQFLPMFPDGKVPPKNEEYYYEK